MSKSCDISVTVFLQQVAEEERRGGGQGGEMVNLLWEQQTVSENLALLRSHLDMLDRCRQLY